MKLSLCCLTADRPAMVAAILAVYRPVVDEIVVAVDRRVDPAALAPLHDVADRVLRFEYRETPEQARPWLIAQCRHPLALMIDGDEVPSRALLEVLPALARDPGETQFRIARRWVYPTVDRWLDERPWWPDLQRRLVLTSTDLDFDLQFHGGIRAAGTTRIVMQPIYHLACVLRTFAERRDTARRYAADRPGMLAPGGGDMNETLYLPEHYATRTLAPTPPDDVTTLRRVLEVADDVPTDLVPAIVPAAEIDRYVPPDPLDAGGYRVRLELVEADLRTDPGFDTTVIVRVTNDGEIALPRRDGPGVQVRACARVLDRRPGGRDGSWSRVSLPGDIPAGESRNVEFVLNVPEAPGIYLVEFDLINERSRWFGCVHTADVVVATRWARFELDRWEQLPGGPRPHPEH